MPLQVIIVPLEAMSQSDVIQEHTKMRQNREAVRCVLLVTTVTTPRLQ